jgi:hypothetical protein
MKKNASMGDVDLHRDRWCLHDASRMNICASDRGYSTTILPDQRSSHGLVIQEDPAYS